MVWERSNLVDFEYRNEFNPTLPALCGFIQVCRVFRRTGEVLLQAAAWLNVSEGARTGHSLKRAGRSEVGELTRRLCSEASPSVVRFLRILPPLGREANSRYRRFPRERCCNLTVRFPPSTSVML